MRKPKNDMRGYVFIIVTIASTTKSPTHQEIANHMGYASKRSSQLMVQRLESQGLILYRAGKIATDMPKGLVKNVEDAICKLRAEDDRFIKANNLMNALTSNGVAFENLTPSQAFHMGFEFGINLRELK